MRLLWNSKKSDYNLTQVTAGKKMGMTQAAFSQLINGNMRVNVRHILEFSALMKVQPSEIDPKLTNVRLD